MDNEEAIAVLRHATDSALFRGDQELATALVCGINALKTKDNPFERPVDQDAEKVAAEKLRRMVSGIFR